jgi:hypothetical protein
MGIASVNGVNRLDSEGNALPLEDDTSSCSLMFGTLWIYSAFSWFLWLWQMTPFCGLVLAPEASITKSIVAFSLL